VEKRHSKENLKGILSEKQRPTLGTADLLK
jgi:hypothetical protein